MLFFLFILTYPTIYPCTYPIVLPKLHILLIWLYPANISMHILPSYPDIYPKTYLRCSIHVYPEISLHLTSWPGAATAWPSAAPPPFAPSQQPLRVGVGGRGAWEGHHRWCGDRDGGLAARPSESRPSSQGHTGQLQG